MSTYVHRFIEVKTKEITQLRKKPEDEGFEGLLKPNKYYSYWDGGDKHYILTENDDTQKIVWKEVEDKDIPAKWELVKWYSDATKGYCYEDETSSPFNDPDNGKNIKLKGHRMFCDNGGVIRDNYIGHGWTDDDKFQDRGYPTDMSEELKKELEHKDGEEDYTWGHTYVLLSEWGAERDKLIEKFKNNVISRVQDKEFNKINEKLDLIMCKCKDPHYEPEPKEKKEGEEYDSEEDGIYYEDTVDYLFEEDFWDIMQVTREMCVVGHIVDEIYGWTSPEQIRIVYYCD